MVYNRHQLYINISKLLKDLFVQTAFVPKDHKNDYSRRVNVHRLLNILRHTTGCSLYIHSYRYGNLVLDSVLGRVEHCILVSGSESRENFQSLLLRRAHFYHSHIFVTMDFGISSYHGTFQVGKPAISPTSAISANQALSRN